VILYRLRIKHVKSKCTRKMRWWQHADRDDACRKQGVEELGLQRLGMYKLYAGKYFSSFFALANPQISVETPRTSDSAGTSAPACQATWVSRREPG
jgi:hypothetical protein